LDVDDEDVGGRDVGDGKEELELDMDSEDEDGVGTFSM
jgi:hypothetical protein